MTAIARIADIPDSPGFGRYELLASSGQGLRGPVFVARSLVPGAAELYQLEVSAFAAAESNARYALVRDLEILARVQHRNVIGVVEQRATTVGHEAVMPYIEACTLAELEARTEAARPARLVVAAIIEALQGLHAVHEVRDSAPVVHGNLSSEYLWLCTDGACRVAGFGHAHDRSWTATSQRDNAALGFRAPEQLRGGEADPRTDVFSIGVILWNALTGKRLFHDPLETMTSSNVLARKVPRPSMIGFAPPAGLDGVVMKALERDPVRRFHSAAEMADALRDAALRAGCATARGEQRAWVAATFGSELITRRHTLHEIAMRPHAAELPVLPPLVPPSVAAPTVRDYLSLDELARANDPPSQLPPPPALPQTAHALRVVAGSSSSESPAPPAPSAAPPAVLRPRPLALAALVAIALLAGAIGWRWLAAPTTHAVPASSKSGAAVSSHGISSLEVTVLDVRRIAAPASATAVPTAPASH